MTMFISIRKCLPEGVCIQCFLIPIGKFTEQAIEVESFILYVHDYSPSVKCFAKGVKVSRKFGVHIIIVCSLWPS